MDLAGIHGEIDVAERANARKALADAAHLQHCRHRHVPSFVTTHRLRGEVGLRSNSGEGNRRELTVAVLAERAPHPCPLPVRTSQGQGEGNEDRSPLRLRFAISRSLLLRSVELRALVVAGVNKNLLEVAL